MEIRARKIIIKAIFTKLVVKIQVLVRGIRKIMIEMAIKVCCCGLDPCSKLIARYLC